MLQASCFGAPKDFEQIARAGYLVVEMQYSHIADLTKEAFEKVKHALRDSGLSMQVIDNPLPLNVSICNSDFRLDDYRDYLKAGAQRAAELGGRYCLFGNGRTRSLPETGSLAQMRAGREKVLEVISYICELHAACGMTVLLEPLSKTVSNFMLSLPEATAICAELGFDNMASSLDLRWFLDSNRPYSDIYAHIDQMLHVHVDCPNTSFPTRLIPRLNDGFDYRPFFEALRAAGYEGLVACEANTFTDFDRDLEDLGAFFSSFGILK